MSNASASLTLSALHGTVTADIRRGAIDASGLQGTMRLETGIGNVVVSRARLLLLLALVAATVGCDRGTKILAAERLAGRGMHSYLGDTVRLVYAENAGAFLKGKVVSGVGGASANTENFQIFFSDGSGVWFVTTNDRPRILFQDKP